MKSELHWARVWMTGTGRRSNVWICWTNSGKSGELVSVSRISKSGCDLVGGAQCPVSSASFHLRLGCHESLGWGKITDLTMDSTSKLGALTASFLSSFNGRKSFSTKKNKLFWQYGQKGGEKEGRAGRLQGEHHRGQGKQVDREAKTLKEASFLWRFDTDSIKKTAGVCPARRRDNANPCPLTGQDLQGEADAECCFWSASSLSNSEACSAPAWGSDKLLLAASHDHREITVQLWIRDWPTFLLAG